MWYELSVYKNVHFFYNFYFNKPVGIVENGVAFFVTSSISGVEDQRQPNKIRL